MTQKYYLYILKCSDNTLYTGITTDIEKRIHAHNFLPTWAKYTKARRPVELVYQEVHDSKSLASKREYQIKQLKRKEKLILIKW